jgi:hypothetical protein
LTLRQTVLCAVAGQVFCAVAPQFRGHLIERV